ncbi:calcium-binding protein [Seminavis robusta]|uniref:Calcium-binding protein n=1 Tax=Seminavis robusta TaxID=568900 RepID=A0A9N8EXP1_9STRA|nr:calcium-binding protein [Seminavis robusta]|eukprot:Sro2372_g325240.1 calcium-binding protein (388) ;mRNA; f:1358-2521
MMQQPKRRKKLGALEQEDDDDDDDKHVKYAKQRKASLMAKGVVQKRRRSSTLSEASDSEHSLTQRALDSFRHTAVLSLKSNRVDAFLAALGCAGSLALLQYWSVTFPAFALTHSCLVSSSIKFFFNENPPSLRAFWQSSIMGLVTGITLHFVPTLCGHYTRHVFLFVTVLYWKLQGGLWSAANTLAMTVADDSGGWTTMIPTTFMINQYYFMSSSNDNDNDTNSNITDTTSSNGQPLSESTADDVFPWKFVLLPYLSGHLILYTLATLLSMIRTRVRITLIRQEFISKEVFGAGTSTSMSIVCGKERRKRLWQLFQRMDTSGDGQLDAVELQVALRAATGTEISMADTNLMIRAVDSDGNGTVDFDEFCASIDKLWIQLIERMNENE